MVSFPINHSVRTSLVSDFLFCEWCEKGGIISLLILCIDIDDLSLKLASWPSFLWCLGSAYADDIVLIAITFGRVMCVLLSMYGG